MCRNHPPRQNPEDETSSESIVLEGQRIFKGPRLLPKAGELYGVDDSESEE